MATGLALFGLFWLYVRVPRKVIATVRQVRRVGAPALIPWSHWAGTEPKLAPLVDSGFVHDP